MIRKFLSLFTVIVGFILIPGVTFAAGSFYEGKTVRIIVGYPPGGGYDTYVRIIARHMGRNIPGNPNIIVENMPGAGSLVAANYLYKIAKPDGLIIGHVGGGQLLRQVFGEPGIQFDARKFEYLGAPVAGNAICVTTKASGITSIDKWIGAKTPVKMGGHGPGTMIDTVLRIAKEGLGFPTQIVTGYAGSPGIFLAMDSGEVAGTVVDWESLSVVRPKDLERGNWVVILQTKPKPYPDLPNVPLAINFAKTDEARQLVEWGLHKHSTLTRPFFLPPGTPKGLVQILEESFQKTMKDKELLAEAKGIRLSFDPVSADDLREAIAGFFKLPPAMLAKLNEIIFKE